jgi:hypothetical protein
LNEEDGPEATPRTHAFPHHAADNRTQASEEMEDLPVEPAVGIQEKHGSGDEIPGGNEGGTGSAQERAEERRDERRDEFGWNTDDEWPEEIKEA